MQSKNLQYLICFCFVLLLSSCGVHRISLFKKEPQKTSKKAAIVKKQSKEEFAENKDSAFIENVEEDKVYIMGEGKASVKQMARFLLKGNSEISIEKAVKIALAYRQEGQKEGVNHDIAFAQMCLETNFLKYGNQVSASQNNFCGLGATDDGAAGCSFSTMRLGVRAHIQHLKAYASSDNLNETKIDPRFHYVSRGSAPTIYKLSLKWASDKKYGEKIFAIVNRLHD